MKHLLLLILLAGLLSCNNDRQAISLFFYGNNLIQDDHAREIFNEGLDFARVEKFKKAKEKFEEADAIEPNNPVIYNSLGLISFYLKNDAEMGKWFLKAMTVDSTYINTYINYGNCLNSIGKYRDAIKIMLQGEKQNIEGNEMAPLYYNISLSYMNLDDCDKAKRSIEKGFNMVSDNKLKSDFIKLRNEINSYCDN